MPGDNVRGHIGLQLAGDHFKLILAVGLALLGYLVRFGLLHGGGLHGHLLAAQIGRVDLVRIALLHGPCRSGIKMAYEINRFQTFLGYGERRNADIVLGSDRWNDRIEIRGFRIRLKAEHLRQSLGDIDIEADRGLAVLRKEFGGSIRRVHADGELAVLRHIIGQQFGDVIVFLHRRNVITRQFARFRPLSTKPHRRFHHVPQAAPANSIATLSAHAATAFRLFFASIYFSYVSLGLFDRI